MRQTLLRLPTRRKQRQKSEVSRQWSQMWLLLVSMSLALLAACGGTPAQPTASATSAATTAATGQIAGVIACSSLAQKDFSTVLSDATVKITSATTVAASGSTPESCKIDGVISPQIKFEVQLPTKQWNGNYFEGGCGGLCGMLSESADCQSAFITGDAVGYNDMGHESSMGNNSDMSWALNETQRQDFAYLANHSVAVLAKALIKTSSVDQEVGRLSGGNQQKVVFAKWLEAKPDVLLLDDPTRGIDVGARADLYALMRELARGGAVQLLASTDPKELAAVCGRVHVFYNGSLCVTLEPPMLDAHTILEVMNTGQLPVQHVQYNLNSIEQ